MKIWTLLPLAALLASGTAQAADFTLRVGVVTPTDHPHSVSAREFERIVEEKSGGRIDVAVHDNGTLGSNPELLDGVKAGVIDICINTPGVMAEYANVTGILELPYVFQSIDHMLAVTRGEIGKEIAKTYEEKAGMAILAYFGGAERNMITRSKPIASIDDLAGLKMRTWEWDVILGWWSSLGAYGAVVAFPETYSALQTGVVDGAENEYSTFTSARWAEVAPYVALTQHNVTVRPVVMNLASLEKLPDDLKAVVRDAALEAADFDVALEQKLDRENKTRLEKEFGVTFTSPDKAPFIAKTVPVIDAYAQKEGVTELAERIRAAAK
ncbi:TRAP transporter substrate-binding protein [Azospirillum sp. ST 5-10]|uniref:TRAP transporter substrate-binding protein n=1 Tax=unclassified Azospirillum TaxID=2630922 RepID=UPI003F49BD3A